MGVPESSKRGGRKCRREKKGAGRGGKRKGQRKTTRPQILSPLVIYGPGDGDSLEKARRKRDEQQKREHRLKRRKRREEEKNPGPLSMSPTH